MPFQYEVSERIAVLSETGGGYTLELNKVAFGNNPPKLDLRRWRNGIPLKGVSLTDDEAQKLMEVLENGKTA